MSAVLGRVLRYWNNPLSRETTIPCTCLASHLEGYHWRKPGAYQALLDASDDDDNEIREIAELVLQPTSPRRQWESRGIFSR